MISAIDDSDTRRGVLRSGRFEFPIIIGGAPPPQSQSCPVNTAEPKGITLRQALTEADQNRWAGIRSHASTYAQARIAVETIEHIIVPWVAVSSITKDHVRAAVRHWTAEGLSPRTMRGRLSCLSAMGVAVQGCRPKSCRALKWWLSPQAEAMLLPWLRDHGTREMALLADYVEWTTLVGLRVEETLALGWEHIHRRSMRIKGKDGVPAHEAVRTLITVPGRKTSGAQATLLLSAEAEAVLERRRALGEPKPFAINYVRLGKLWRIARAYLGETVPRHATLKALRRNAARSLHATKGMPLDMVRQYLRHSNIATTMGYLRLTGGYGEEEMAQWL